MQRRIPRFALLAVFTVIVGVFPFSGDSLWAGVLESPHDFSITSQITRYKSTPIAPAGACSICHIPHNAQYGALWPRDLLSTYDNALGMNGGTGATDKPNYKRPVTVQCIDCHDAHVTTDKINDVPAFNAFETNHKPQNIAFGFTKGGSTDSGSTMKEDGPAGIVSGYYENNPPYATSPTTYYGADSSTGSPFKRPLDNATLLKTGGHYFKTLDPTSGSVYKGDKLPCSDCHDPHAWDKTGSWQAFFRKNWPSGSLVASRLGLPNSPTTLRASPNMANDPIPTSPGRDTATNGRLLCTVCHGTSDTILPVAFNHINSAYSSTSPIIRPPATVGEHTGASQIACVSCHGHNAIGANCAQCHGFPPSSTATPGYPATAASTFVPSTNPGAADSHPRHYGGRSGEARNALPGFVYKFDCGMCHFGSALGTDPTLQHHQNSRVSVVIQGTWTAAPNGAGPFGTYDNTNYYNPSYPGGPTGQLDNTQSAGGWGGTANRPLGDTYGWNQCRNVYCHSIGRKIASMTAGDNNHYRQDVKWNSGAQRCNSCHGRSVSDNTNPAWGMPDYAGGVVGSDNANSHNAHVVRAGYECSVCHSVTVAGTGANRAILATPVPSNHVNGVREVVFDGTNATGTYADTPATKTCVVSCHGNNPVRWGGPQQNCDTCHVRTGDVDDFGTGSQASMSHNGITAGIDNNEWNWSGHGRDTGAYDVSANPAAALLTTSTGTNKCAFCHNPAIAHDNASNPFRLANNNVFSQGWNGACYVCHATPSVGDSTPGYAPAPDNGTYVAKTATQKVGNNHYNPGTASNARHSLAYNGGAFCWDCHDPHGDRNSSGTGNIFMVGARVAMRTDNVYGIPSGGTASASNPATGFTNNATGADFASTDNAAPYDRLCEVCHDGASGILHYRNTGTTDSPAHNPTRCTTCHTHDGGFRGLGGPDVGQYFDRSIQAPGPSNYADNSSHPLRGLTTGDTTLRFTSGVNCLGCHYSSGPARTSDECLMCHFENGPSPVNGGQLGANHMDGVLELADPTTASGSNAPSARFTVGSITQFDAWCLACHQGTTASLGGITPSSARRTVIDASGFANGRHRAVVPPDGPIGCIYCHQPHGRGNARIVRENPQNRRAAATALGQGPLRFGVFPTDNLGLGGYGAGQNVPYRARFDNTLPNVYADAADDHGFCNAACHDTTPSRRKDKVIRRDDNITGNYTLSGSGVASKKIYFVNGFQYTNDNTATWMHGHVNNEIITTDNMVIYFSGLVGLTGPSYYKYPGTGNANPATFNNYTSPLPFFPDIVDGSRDFTNGYINLGQLRYRFTCSTCHNPHGTTLGNTSGSDGYPDLRLRRLNPPDLCNECHK